MQTCELPQTENHLALLGKPMRALFEQFGEPFSEVAYRGNTALMFESGQETVVCETHSDVVLSVNAFKDRRTAARIRPLVEKPAYLSHNGNRYLATVIDISVKSVAIKMHDGPLPVERVRVDFCTTLGSWTNSRTHVTFSGTVYKVFQNNNSIVVIFDSEHKTQSHSVLQDYINHSLIREHIGPIITNRPQSAVVEIIKSDICGTRCDINTCILR